ncbi:hypothetical protein M1329_00760 [Candidatus Marsarchaeota archaeon]|nr:hypothetical protein [Candidatus Marsarchaeota archaeon]MCL5100091.1 hypothetical protein [Candidatus Marsarchaeota archaeon]
MKQQSALEMLVVYSWAILLIGIFVALALVISGSTKPSGYLPGTCSIQPLLPCAETLLTGYSSSAPISFIMEFVNQLGVTMEFPANAINLTVTNLGSSGTNSYYGSCNPSKAANGAHIICKVEVPGTTEPAVGSQSSALFAISYDLCASSGACTGPYISTGTSTQSLMASQFALAYVTLSASPNVGHIVINGLNYYTGTEAVLVSGKYTVYGSPPSGYAFSSWTAGGNVIVSAQNSQNTTATVTGNGTLSANFVTAPS